MPASTLTAIICNYNDSARLGEALEAMGEQSRPPDELLVIDDGSTDGSIELLNSYAERYPMLRVEKNDRNMGVLFSATRGLNLATGDYVYFGSANDKVLPGLFEKSMAMVEKFPDAALSCADIIVENRVEQVTAELRKGWLLEPGYISPDELAIKYRQGIPEVQPYCFGHTCVMRRDLFTETDAYITEMRWHSDWFAVHVIALRNGVCYIPEPLALARINQNSYSSVMDQIGPETEIFSSVVRHFATPKFHDTVPLLCRSRAMACAEMNSVNKVGVMMGLLRDPHCWNREYFLLTTHFVWEFLELRVIADARKAAGNATARLSSISAGAVTKAGGGLNYIFGPAVNACEQLYARAFHEYDRLRKFLRGGA